MADVQVSLSFTGQEDVTQAAQKVEDAIKRVGKGQLRAEEDLKAIIARDDPGKMAELRRDRELKRIAQYVVKHRDLTAQGELARKKVIEQYEREIAGIRKRGADYAVQATTQSVNAVSKMRPALAGVVQTTNAMGSAVGLVASQYTGLASGMVASFASGGLVVGALAATAAAVTALISKFQESERAAKEAAEATAKAEANRQKDYRTTIDELDEIIRRQRIVARGGNIEVENAVRDVAQAQADVNVARQVSRAADRSFTEAQSALASEGIKGPNANAEQLRVLQARLNTERQIRDLRRDELAKSEQVLKRLEEIRRGMENPPPPPASDSGGGRGGGRAAGGRVAPPGESLAVTMAKLKAELAQQRREDAFAAIDSEEQAAKEQAARVAKLRAAEENKAHQEALTKEAKSEAYVKAGMAAGGQFAQGFAQILAQGGGNAPTILGVFSSALGVLLSGINPAAGAAFGAFTGAVGLREGGGLPQGRAGIGNPGNDARLVWMHPREVIQSAPAVEAMGGMDAALRFNDAARSGRSMRMGGSSAPVVVLPTLLPQDAAAAVRQSIRPGLETIMTNAQSAAFRHDLQRYSDRPRVS